MGDLAIVMSVISLIVAGVAVGCAVFSVRLSRKVQKRSLYAAVGREIDKSAGEDG